MYTKKTTINFKLLWNTDNNGLALMQHFIFLTMATLQADSFVQQTG